MEILWSERGYFGLLGSTHILIIILLYHIGRFCWKNGVSGKYDPSKYKGLLYRTITLWYESYYFYRCQVDKTSQIIHCRTNRIKIFFMCFNGILSHKSGNQTHFRESIAHYLRFIQGDMFDSTTPSSPV